MPKQLCQRLADPGCVPRTCRGLPSSVFCDTSVVNKAHFWLSYGTGLIILQVLEDTAYLVEYWAVWGTS